MDCLFCKIINKEIPAGIFYEDAETIAFLDIAPANFGHSLVMSKTHCKNILDCSDEIMAVVAKRVKMLAPKIMAATGADGINVTSNNEAVAGQIVMHMHWHLIPRYPNDGLLSWPKKEGITAEQNAALLEKIHALN